MAIKAVKVKIYDVLRQVGEADKCPPQAQLIVKTITANGGPIERDKLIELLSRPVDQGGLKTNQTPARILAFYRQPLQEMGILQESTVVREIEVPDPPVKEKPAKAAAAEPVAGEAVSAVAEPKSVKGAKGKKSEAA